MDIQAYISSGVIENYVLGLATQEEAQELEQLCARYPEIRAARIEAEEALEAYALLHAEAPPENLKAAVWEAVSTDIPPKKREGTVSRIVAIAASILLVASIILHIVQITGYKQQIEQLKKEKNELVAQNKTFMAQIGLAREELGLVEDPEVKTVVLAGVHGHDANRAILYWHNQSKAVYLKPGNLPALPSGKQYQLWAIIDGKPVSAGVYEGVRKPGNLQKMSAISRAEMFAITIEKAGGSEAPTLDQMIVAGKI